MQLLLNAWLPSKNTVDRTKSCEEDLTELKTIERQSYRLKLGKLILAAQASLWARLSFPLSVTFLGSKFLFERRRLKRFYDIDIGLPADPLRQLSLGPQAHAELKTRRRVLTELLAELNMAENGQLKRTITTGHKSKSFLHVGAMPFSETPSGYNLKTEQLCAYLEAQGALTHKLHIGYNRNSDKNGKIESNRVSFSVNFSAKGDLEDLIDRCINEILNEARSANADFIVAGSNWLNGYCAWRAAQKINIPFVYEARGLWHYTRSYSEPSFEKTWAFSFQEKAEIAIMNAADHVFAISNELKDFAVSNGANQNKISVVPNMTTPLPSRATLKVNSVLDLRAELLGAPEGGILLGYAGSITAYERLEIVLNMLALAENEKKKNKMPLKFAIAGAGGEEGRLRRLAKNLDVVDNVIWLGSLPREALCDLIKAVDIMVYPRANHKTFQIVPPLKPLDPMLLGTACLMSNILPHKHLAGPDNERAVIISSDNPTDWLQVVLGVMDNKTVSSAMVDRAKKWVVKERSPEHVMQPWLEYLKG